MKKFNEIITEGKANIKYDGVPSKFTVVTKAFSKDAGINDIMFDTSIDGIALQYLGGLKPSEILFVSNDKKKAEAFAKKVLKVK